MLIYRSIYGDTTHYAEYSTHEDQYFLEKEQYPGNTLLKSIVPLYGGKVTSRTYKVTTDEYNEQKTYLVKYIPEGQGKTTEISVAKSQLSAMGADFHKQIPEVYYINEFVRDDGYPVRTNIPHMTLYNARQDDQRRVRERLVWQEYKEGKSPKQLTDDVLTQIAQFQGDLHAARSDIEDQTKNLLHTIITKKPLNERIEEYAHRVWGSIKSENNNNDIDPDKLRSLYNGLVAIFGLKCLKNITPQNITSDDLAKLLFRELPKRYDYTFDPLLSFVVEPKLYETPLFTANLAQPFDNDYVDIVLNAIQKILHPPVNYDDGTLSPEALAGLSEMVELIENFPPEKTQKIMRESLYNNFASYSSGVAHDIFRRYKTSPDPWVTFLKEFKAELLSHIQSEPAIDSAKYDVLFKYKKTTSNTVDGIDFIASKFEEWQKDVTRFHKKFTNEPIHEDDQNRTKKYGKIEPYNMPKIQRLLKGKEETIYNLYSSIPFIKTYGSAANFKKRISLGGAKDFVTAMCLYMQDELTRLQNTINDRLSAIAASGKDINLPFGYTHGDLHKDNVLFKGEKLSAVIDYETLSKGGVAFDLATTV